MFAERILRGAGGPAGTAGGGERLRHIAHGAPVCGRGVGLLETLVGCGALCGIPYAWYVLCQAALARGQYAEARSHARQAQAAVQVAGDRWFTAYCLLASGDVARALGEQDEARAHYRAAYAIREEFADREGMAIALAHLGKAALLAADYAEARRLYARSQAIYEDLADRGGLATALHGLGLAAAAGDQPAARAAFARALRLATEGAFTPLALAILTSVGALFVRAGRPEPGVALLTFARRHPAGDRETRERARRLLAEAAPRLPRNRSPRPRGAASPAISTASRHARRPNWPRHRPAATPGAPATDQPVRRPDRPLVEPLTERELAVLRPIAAGRSNQQIADELFLAVPTVKRRTRSRSPAPRRSTCPLRCTACRAAPRCWS